MTRKQALALVKKHGSQNKAARAIGMPRVTFQRRLNGMAGPQIQPVKKTLKEFKNIYDRASLVPIKVKAALADLGSNWVYDGEFRCMSGVSATDLNKVRDQFKDFIVRFGNEGRCAWSGSKATIAKMRSMV